MEEKELLEVVTEDGTPTGKILPRGEIHEKKLLHNEIAVFVINDKNQILLDLLIKKVILIVGVLWMR